MSAISNPLDAATVTPSEEVTKEDQSLYDQYEELLEQELQAEQELRGCQGQKSDKN